MGSSSQHFSLKDQENIATIKAMRRQEDLSYTCRNAYQEMALPQVTNPASKEASSSSMNSLTPEDECVTLQTRMILCDWAHKITDFCDLDRETAEIAMSYVDHFVQTERGIQLLHQSNQYQILVVTALYVAIKVHETVAVSATQFEKISRNMFTAKDIEAMEQVLLPGLGWHLHPPTTLGFVRLFLDLIPDHVLQQEMKETAYILTKIQSELAVRDCALVSVQASTIAFAALMNALEALGMLESNNGARAVHDFLRMADSLDLINKRVLYNGAAILLPIQTRLYQAIAKQTDISFFGSRETTVTTPVDHPPKKGISRQKSCDTTPRSVIGRSFF